MVCDCEVNTNMNAKTESASVSDQVAEAAHEAVERLARSAAEAEERIRKAAEEAETKLRKSSEQAQQESKELGQTITDYVNEHPIKSVGIAFAAGALFSALLRR